MPSPVDVRRSSPLLAASWIALSLTVFGCGASNGPDEVAQLIADFPEPPQACRFEDLVRQELYIDSATQGVSLFMFRMPAFGESKGAVLLLHGAGSPGSALWDLTTKDYSMMRRLACAGFDTYTLDVRGFGGSTQPRALLEDAEGAAPAVRAADVMPDVDAALRFAQARSSVDRVDLVGWSWGCVVAGMAAGRFADRVRRLVLFAPVYDRKWPTRHKTVGAWRSEARDLYFKYFDAEREERAVLEEHVAALFRFVGANEVVRLPNGPYRDLYGEDAPIWDPASIRAPTLVVRGENDRASLREPAYRLFQSLKNAPVRRYSELGGAGHFAFRTRQYRRLQAVVHGFLTEDF